MRRRLPIAAALAALVVAALAYLARDGGAERRAEGARPPATVPSHAEGGTEQPGPAAPGGPRPGEDGRRIDVEEPTVIDTPAGPVALEPGEYDLRVDGAEVTVTVHRGRAVHRADGETRVAETGGVLSLRATTGGAVPPRPATTGPTTTVTGRVVDGAQKPIAGARIWVGAERVTGGRIAATTDADGRYRAEDVAGTPCFVGARADGRAPSGLRVIRPETQAVFEMDFVLRKAGGALRIEVRDPEGRPVTGAAVTVGGTYCGDEGLTSPEGYRIIFVGPRALTTDSAGIAEALDLPPQWNTLRVVAAGFAPYYANARLSPGVEETRRITLERGVVVQGTVRDAGGIPVAGVQVGFRQAGSGREIDVVGATTDERGEYRIAHVPVRRLEVFARAKDGRAASAWLVLETGVAKRWDAVLAEARELQGRVVYDDGEPAAGARVRCRRVRLAGENHPDATTDEAGAFRFAPVEWVAYDLFVWHPDATTAAPTRRVRVMPDSTPKITLPREPEPPAFVKGVVVLPGGEPAPGAEVATWPVDAFDWSARGVTGADGAFRLGPLGPGRHRLEVHVDGQPTLHLEAEIAPAEEHDFGVLELPGGGRIRARVVGPDGAPVHRSYVLVASLDQRIQYSVKPDTEGFWISEGLAPGRYLVYGGALGLSTEAEVRAGETTQVELKLPPMGKLAVTFLLEEGTAPRLLSYEVRDEAGHRVAYGNLDAGTNRLDVTLAAGTYTVTGRDERGHTAEAKLAAPAGGEAAQTLTLR